MRKISYVLFIIVLFISLAPSYVFAKQDVVPFLLAPAETDDFQPKQELSVTLLEALPIKAEVEKGAVVELVVTFDEQLELEPKVYDPVSIGASGRYRQEIGLELGDNILEITVTKEGFETRKESYTIKRLDKSKIEKYTKAIFIPVPTEKPAPAPAEKPAPAPAEKPAPASAEKPAPAPAEKLAPAPAEK